MAVTDLTVRTTRADDDTQVIALEGELDLYSVDTFRDALDEALAAEVERIVVDASDVTIIDSVALGVLANAMKRQRDTGGSIALVATNPNIVRTFEITGLDRMLRITGSLSEALARV